MLRGGGAGLDGLVLPAVGLRAGALSLDVVRGGGPSLEVVRRSEDPVSRGGALLKELPGVVSLSLRLGGLGLRSIISEHADIHC